jgi:hydrogenase maturation factor
LLLPEGETNREDVDRIFEQIQDACTELEVSLVGGHTEITHAIDRPIAVGAMFGEVAPNELVRSDGAQLGDALILTKGIAVEGTAIIARELGDRLASEIDPELLKHATNFLHDPGISVVHDAMIAAEAGDVHAMHDPTEGGVATGIREMTQAAGYGARIDRDALKIYPETLAICNHLKLDPLGLIASGALLIAAAPADATAVTDSLHEAGIAANVVGEVCEEPEVTLIDEEGEHPLPTFDRDEIARLFERSAPES